MKPVTAAEIAALLRELRALDAIPIWDRSDDDYHDRHDAYMAHKAELLGRLEP